MKRIIMIRHLLTLQNGAKRYIGRRTDEDILPGQEDIAKRASENIRSLIVGEAAYFTGPMKRCRNTAGLLFPDRVPTVIEDLTEIDFGEFEGKDHESLKEDKTYKEWLESGATVSFPKGEDREAFIKRSMDCFYEICDLFEDNDTAVIICHGGNIMAIMSTLTGKDYYGFMAGNLEGYTVDIENDDERISVISYDRFGGGDLG